ncbi:hypothetical protein DDD63_06075 [Actinobaculum sp. 313]|nr:hypothetical protein DDD63_06075 [Actinobaculum sp. 313]
MLFMHMMRNGSLAARLQTPRGVPIAVVMRFSAICGTVHHTRCAARFPGEQGERKHWPPQLVKFDAGAAGSCSSHQLRGMPSAWPLPCGTFYKKT